MYGLRREPSCATQGLSIVACGGSAFDIRSPLPLSFLLPTAHGYSQSRTLHMTDCPHEHEPDTGLQTFKDIVREEFDQPSDSIRRDRPHRAVRRLQGLVRIQPFQPRKRPSLLRLHLGHLQNQNGKKQRPQAVQSPPRAPIRGPAPYSDTGARPVLDTGASDLSKKERQRTRTGREGPKQGGNDFPKAPCLPKLDRIRPSFGQGAKGAKGAFFEKLFAREQPTHLS